MPDLAALQKRLGYKFRDENLLRLALTHPSVAHESGVANAHNQRLEFLGDAVLRFVQSEILYEKFPLADEGSLSKTRALMENESALAGRANLLDLGAHLILSSSAERTGAREKLSVLADAFEALLAAVFLDGGFEAAHALTLREFAASFKTLAESSSIENPKSELQELLHLRSQNEPEYQTVSATGPDHDRVFECIVQHEGVELARGRGKSKKAAESDAALAALKKLRGEKPV